MAIDVAKITQYFPQYAWLVNNPEIGPKLEQAANEGWDAGKLAGAIESTNWWKTQSPDTRTYLETQARDPGAAAESQQQREAQVWDQARSLGLNLNVAQVQSLADQSLKFGWSDSQLIDSLVGQTEKQGFQGTQANLGQIANSMAAIKTNASNYYTNIDDNTAFQYATQVASGERKVEDFNQLFKEQARARFSYSPQLVEQIDQGFTPEQLFQPQKNQIAQLLEVDPSQVNLNDSKWNQVLDYADNGTRRAATVGETAKIARSTSEWRKTLNGQQAAASLAGNISKLFTGN